MIEAKLQHLEAFRVLAEELHFGHAAERIGTSQPYLSQIIGELERKLDARLFERRPTVRLTVAGEAFLDSVRRALNELAFGAERVRGGRPEVFPVSLGIASTVALGPIGTVLTRFGGRSDYRLILREMHSGDQQAALRSGAIDLAVLRDVPERGDLEWQSLLSEELVAIVPAGFPRKSMDSLALAALADEPFILFRREASPRLHRVLVDACQTSGFSPRIVQEVEEWHTIAALVGLGLGVSIAPHGVSRLRVEGVDYLRLADSGFRTDLCICWLKDRLRPAAVELRDVLIAHRSHRQGQSQQAAGDTLG